MTDTQSHSPRQASPTHPTTWYEVGPEAFAKKLPKWMRQAAIDENDTIWVPAVIAASEMAVFLCAGYDGTQVIVNNKHLYVPSEWLAREFPHAAEACSSIERRLRAAT